MIEVDLQLASEADAIPSEDEFKQWVSIVLEKQHREGELTIRVVDEAEGRGLNHQYRDRDYPTNVLSFPADLPAELEIPFLGDLVICAPVVAKEAQEQEKPVQHHWAHLTIHGILHLLGYDHQDDHEAEEMEALEITFLKELGVANPYQD